MKRRLLACILSFVLVLCNLSFTVGADDTKTIASIEVAEGGMVDTLTMDDYPEFTGTTLIITYTDGSTATAYAGSTDELSGQKISYTVYYLNGDTLPSTVGQAYDGYLPYGTYYVVFYTEDVVSEKYYFTVTKSATVEELELDTGYEVTSFDQNSSWYTYTPEESGTYKIEFYNLYCYVRVQAFTAEGMEFSHNFWSDGDGLEFELEAGTTYIFRIRGINYTGSQTRYSFKLTSLIHATDMTVESDIETEYSTDDAISFDETVFNVTYSNGNTKEITLEYNGYKDIYYTIYDENDEEISTGGEALPAGTYYVVFSCDDATSDQYPFTVTSSGNVTDLTLDNAETVDGAETTWFSFTPSTTEDYLFKVYDTTSLDFKVSIYEDSTKIETYSYSDGEFETDESIVIRASLTAGTTYYFNVTGDSENCGYTVMVTEPSRIKTISVSSMAQESFTMDEYVMMTGTKLTVTYENGTSGTITYKDSTSVYDIASDQYIDYYIRNIDGSSFDGPYPVLASGTYVVCFYVTDMDEIMDEHEITVSMSENMTELTLNLEYSIDVEDDEWVWFSYTPTATSTYVFESYDYSVSDPYMLFYDEQGWVDVYDETEDSSDFYAEIELTAGETYYFMVSGAAMWDAKYRVMLSDTSYVESVSVKSIPTTEFISMEYNSFDGTVLEVTYTDGNTCEATYRDDSDGSASMALTVTYKVFDENGECISTGPESLRGGTHTIVFYVEDVASNPTEITVVKSDQTVTASIENESIECGETTQIEITETGTWDLTYSSSDTSIATVSDTGLITAVGVGTATITVTAAGNSYLNSATATVSVIVTEAGTSYLLGDVNEDGEIDYLDAMTVLRYDAELITLDETQLLAGDVNGDDAVDSLDAILILRYDADLIESF